MTMDRVEARGRVQLPGKADAAARKQLDTRHLVLASSEHTTQGKHAAVVRSWEDWAAGANGGVPEAAARPSLAKARAALHDARIVLR